MLEDYRGCPRHGRDAFVPLVRAGGWRQVHREGEARPAPAGVPHVCHRDVPRVAPSGKHSLAIPWLRVLRRFVPAVGGVEKIGVTLVDVAARRVSELVLHAAKRAATARYRA